eukprot:14758885-Alexandrium_andersonii.AAC.1
MEESAPVPDRDVPGYAGGVAGHGNPLSRPSVSSVMVSAAGPSVARSGTARSGLLPGAGLGSADDGDGVGSGGRDGV